MKLTSVYHLIFLFAIYFGLITEGKCNEQTFARGLSEYDNDGNCIANCVTGDLSKCDNNCICGFSGNCEMPLCTNNCICDAGGCDMPLCTNDCNCNGGNCDMSSCKGWSCNCGAGGCSGPMNARQLAELIPKIVIPIVVALGVLFCWWRKRKNRKMAETAYAPTQTQDQMFPVKQGA